MKIKDLVLNEIVDVTLVVKSATAKETKSKKPYLSLEFYDGTDTIMANYWDWTSGKIPPVNSIMDVKAQVTEWQGIKQLSVKALSTNTGKTLAEFAPDSGYNIAEVYDSACLLMAEVSDSVLRTIALAVLEELKLSWMHVPGAVSVHHNYIGGTLVHSYGVAVKAKALAEVTEGANVDLATVGGMLHDLGKLFAYKLEGVSIDMTTEGKMLEHSFIGAEFIGNFADNHVDSDDTVNYHKLRMLRHIILSHHGQLEYGAAVTPQCIEAYIVHYADSVDAINEQIRVASNKAPANSIWTDKIWTLNNRPHLTHAYVADIMLEKN